MKIKGVHHIDGDPANNDPSNLQFVEEPDYSDPKVQSDISFRYRMHGDPEYNRLRHGLRAIARKGCERLVDPSTCRQEKGGYPREQWCDGCIAAEALGFPRDWFVMKR